MNKAQSLQNLDHQKNINDSVRQSNFEENYKNNQVLFLPRAITDQKFNLPNGQQQAAMPSRSSGLRFKRKLIAVENSKDDTSNGYHQISKRRESSPEGVVAQGVSLYDNNTNSFNPSSYPFF